MTTGEEERGDEEEDEDDVVVWGRSDGLGARKRKSSVLLSASTNTMYCVTVVLLFASILLSEGEKEEKGADDFGFLGSGHADGAGAISLTSKMRTGTATESVFTDLKSELKGQGMNSLGCLR